MKIIYVAMFCYLLTSCSAGLEKDSDIRQVSKSSIVILGTVQDAGSPHAGCKKSCCADLFNHPDATRKVVSLGIIDVEEHKNWMIEASPDLPQQMKMLQRLSPFDHQETPDAIFLTHAHIGHYSGLMYLGRESMNSDKVKVYTMDRMQNFLASNGPWSQLVDLGNIALDSLFENQSQRLSENIVITPFKVPHRDEFSETVGYKISGNKHSCLFIPDIDKWSKWKINIIEEIARVDYALIDATFYDAAEVNHRDISEIPHPFVIESMELMEGLNEEERKKVYFIHLNHTNPLLNVESAASNLVKDKGFNIAQYGQVLEL